MIGRSTYKALVAIFNRQCEVSEGKVVVKAKTSGDRIQNPSDADATYDAHKGRGTGHPLSGTKETWLAPNGAIMKCHLAQGVSQSSSRRPGIFRKSAVLFVTRVKSWTRATAAIIRSMSGIDTPFVSDSPLTLPN